MTIKKALISVSDKTGIVAFARTLGQLDVAVYSTGGTLKALQDAGIPAKSISDITGFPEILDGRVKTLHPKIHGGLLAIRDNATHQKQTKENGIEGIDLVVVNLYPFEATIAKPDVHLDEAIENIDIGGPAMLRSAAKNYKFVTVVTDPADYARVLKEIESNSGSTDEATRFELAKKVFKHTAAYDAKIAEYLENLPNEKPEAGHLNLPPFLHLKLEKHIPMRYGENPHQHAALYNLNGESFDEYFEKLHGKDLSYNNILDATAATNLISEFSGEAPTVAIIKHTNSCGVAQAETLEAAYRKAFSTDTQAPFGGIIAVNKPLDMNTAKVLNEIFTEVVIAPEYEAGVLDFLMKKKDRRLMRLKKSPLVAGLDFRSVAGGILSQERDVQRITAADLKVVTKRQPTADEIRDLLFAWKVAKHIKSNAIVYAKDLQTVGVGAGQMSRIDSSKIARWKAAEVKLELKHSVVASDAFFPFADGLIAAAEVGVSAVIEPGGSVRDEEVIQAADERGLAMVFTGVRHFRH
jgi:phosphoribosylaminoimidazolecarboxamide formyltransferase/IMP cyclohydrolase